MRAAVRLGTDHKARAEVSQEICEKHAVLYEDAATVSEWARFLRTAVAAAASS